MMNDNNGTMRDDSYELQYLIHVFIIHISIFVKKYCFVPPWRVVMMNDNNGRMRDDSYELQYLIHELVNNVTFGSI
jgi:hypothetical protein